MAILTNIALSAIGVMIGSIGTYMLMNGKVTKCCASHYYKYVCIDGEYQCDKCYEMSKVGYIYNLRNYI